MSKVSVVGGEGRVGDPGVGSTCNAGFAYLWSSFHLPNWLQEVTLGIANPEESNYSETATFKESRFSVLIAKSCRNNRDRIILTFF